VRRGLRHWYQTMASALVARDPWSATGQRCFLRTQGGLTTSSTVGTFQFGAPTTAGPRGRPSSKSRTSTSPSCHTSTLRTARCYQHLKAAAEVMLCTGALQRMLSHMSGAPCRAVTLCRANVGSTRLSGGTMGHHGPAEGSREGSAAKCTRAVRIITSPGD
jgi:hypothetical protein